MTTTDILFQRRYGRMPVLMLAGKKSGGCYYVIMLDRAIIVNQHHGVGCHLIYYPATPMVSRHVDIVGTWKTAFGSAEGELGSMRCV